jgi:hypothetical protein
MAVKIAGAFMGAESDTYTPPDKPNESYPYANLKIGDGERYVRIKAHTARIGEMMDAVKSVKSGDPIAVLVSQDRYKNLRFEGLAE